MVLVQLMTLKKGLPPALCPNCETQTNRSATYMSAEGRLVARFCDRCGTVFRVDLEKEVALIEMAGPRGRAGMNIERDAGEVARRRSRSKDHVKLLVEALVDLACRALDNLRPRYARAIKRRVGSRHLRA